MIIFVFKEIVLKIHYVFQVWAIAANGEGREVLAWRHGSVKVLKFLPKPCRLGKKIDSDPYESKRPLVAICDSSSSNPQFSSISISSMRTGEQVILNKFHYIVNTSRYILLISGETYKIQKHYFGYLCQQIHHGGHISRKNCSV